MFDSLFTMLSGQSHECDSKAGEFTSGEAVLGGNAPIFDDAGKGNALVSLNIARSCIYVTSLRIWTILF